MPWTAVTDIFPNLEGATRGFSLAFPFVPVTSRRPELGGQKGNQPEGRGVLDAEPKQG